MFAEVADQQTLSQAPVSCLYKNYLFNWQKNYTGSFRHFILVRVYGGIACNCECGNPKMYLNKLSETF